jgi:uncharacterized protein
VILPDVNLLVHAYNEGTAWHQRACPWLEEVLTASELVALTWPTITGFLRLTTSRFVMENPLAVSDALSIVDTWLEQPLVRIIRPGERHWPILKGLLDGVQVGGNLVTDAHLAALAIEHDCELCSTDNDFARFRRLKWHNPLLPR